MSNDHNDPEEDGQQVSESEEFNHKEEKRLLNLLAHGLSREFPNPDRIGCPDPAVLRSIAFRELPLTESRRYLQHLSTCSPCFQQFSECRKEVERQRRRRNWMAAGSAILILAVAGWIWTHMRKSTTEALDLRQVTAVNPRNPIEQDQQPLVLYRWARRLTLDLPAGSQPGLEEVAVFTQTGVEIFETVAAAEVENQVVYVEVDVDVSKIQSGQYFLGVRQPGLTWTEYRVSVP